MLPQYQLLFKVSAEVTGEVMTHGATSVVLNL